MYVYLAFNTDRNGIAQETMSVVKTNPILVEFNRTNSYLTGIAAGQTEEQQFRAIQNHINRYTGK
jgi:hypothetical protein